MPLLCLLYIVDQTIRVLGAGTGIVGILAGHYGSDATITDLDAVVPLLQYNILRNQATIRGNVTSLPLNWGTDVTNFLPSPDYLILANCIYYESSFEPLAETVRSLASADTEVFVCYEERTEGIKQLIKRWHQFIGKHFSIDALIRNNPKYFCVFLSFFDFTYFPHINNIKI